MLRGVGARDELRFHPRLRIIPAGRVQLQAKIRTCRHANPRRPPRCRSRVGASAATSPPLTRDDSDRSMPQASLSLAEIITQHTGVTTSGTEVILAGYTQRARRLTEFSSPPPPPKH